MQWWEPPTGGQCRVQNGFWCLGLGLTSTGKKQKYLSIIFLLPDIQSYFKDQERLRKSQTQFWMYWDFWNIYSSSEGHLHTEDQVGTLWVGNFQKEWRSMETYKVQSQKIRRLLFQKKWQTKALENPLGAEIFNLWNRWVLELERDHMVQSLI